MKKYFSILVFLLYSSTAFAEEQCDSCDNLLPQVEEYAMLQTDKTTDVNLYLRGGTEIADTVAKDSVIKDKNYWKRQLRKFKLDVHDTSIQYPSFVDFCLKVYRWADKAFNSYDTDYVVGTGKRCRVTLKNENWLEGYRHRLKDDNIKISMLSNLSSSIGLYASYMAVSIGYSFDLDNLWGNRNSRKKFDFEFSCARFAAYAYYHKTTGSVDVTRIGDFGVNNRINIRFDGLSKLSYGLGAHYYFNNRKFSHGAAYSFSKYQKKSAGSLIVGMLITHQQIDIDYSRLSPLLIRELDGHPLQYKFNYNDYAISVGYSYNWVFAKNWLFNVTALPSFGLKYNLHDSSEKTKFSKFSANLKARFSLVHNHNNFFYGIAGYFDAFWYNGPVNAMVNMYGNLGINIGFRFL